MHLTRLFSSFHSANNNKAGRNLIISPPSQLQDSIFSTQRFNNTHSVGNLRSAALSYCDPDVFDPRFHLLITEKSLNDLLFNITISMLSLDIWNESIPVTSTNFRNTYVFSSQLSFFLPYGLRLGFASVYAIIGIRALIINGVPAVDGGFLQIMMATRGRTEMEDIIVAKMANGPSGLSEETLNIKVRFGELFREE